MCPCGVCQRVHISLHHRDAQSFAQCGIAEEFLNDDTITPHPVDLAMSMIHADHPEAYPLMQPQTCRILREDPRHECLGRVVGEQPLLYSMSGSTDIQEKEQP